MLGIHIARYLSILQIKLNIARYLVTLLFKININIAVCSITAVDKYIANKVDLVSYLNNFKLSEHL